MGLNVVEDILEVLEGFRSQATHQPDVGGLDVGVHGDIKGGIPPILLDKVLEHVPRMGSVGGRAYAGGDEHYPRLLPGHRNATCTLLVACQVAFSVGAEATEVAEWHVKGLVTLKEGPVPGTEGSYTGEGGWTQLLIPVLLEDSPDFDLESFEGANYR